MTIFIPLMKQAKPGCDRLIRALIVLAGVGILGCQPKTEKQTTEASPQSKPSPAAVAQPSQEGVKTSSESTPSPSGPPKLSSDSISADPTQSSKPAAGNGGGFTDIENVPTQKYVADLQTLEIFDTSASEFRPYDTLTRGEYITWLYRANNTLRREKDHLRLDPTYDPGFTDIDAEHPAYQYVQAFANAGYAVGYEDKTFKPDQPITREEMIAIKIGLDTEQNHKPTKLGLNYTDSEQIDPRYTGFIRIDHTQNNIARAFGNVKTLKPKQAVKRHEAAATLWKIRFDTAETALKKQKQ